MCTQYQCRIYFVCIALDAVVAIAIVLCHFAMRFTFTKRTHHPRTAFVLFRGMIYNSIYVYDWWVCALVLNRPTSAKTILKHWHWSYDIFREIHSPHAPKPSICSRLCQVCLFLHRFQSINRCMDKLALGTYTSYTTLFRLHKKNHCPRVTMSGKKHSAINLPRKTHTKHTQHTHDTRILSYSSCPDPNYVCSVAKCYAHTNCALPCGWYACAIVVWCDSARWFHIVVLISRHREYGEVMEMQQCNVYRLYNEPRVCLDVTTRYGAKK